MIRNYVDEDLNDLLDTWAAASEVAHPFLTPEFLASERQNIPNLYLPNAERWVYEDGGRVVGHADLSQHSSCWNWSTYPALQWPVLTRTSLAGFKGSSAVLVNVVSFPRYVN